ncbi:MAG: universal stress protein [Anaerolineaceae bacterium]|nr:universal stress protein [Anaerolineaceae bacterium]
MFKHILVPLDGSRLAEAALPPAASLAGLLHANVTLIHVIEEHAPEQVHGERHLTGEDEACNYLSEIAGKAFPSGVKVDQHVHPSGVKDVARSIVDHSSEFEPDLIVMCTHGRGGLRNLLVGSIAQQVIGGGNTPVLLIHPEEDNPVNFSCQHILVPLDTKPAHEQGLRVAFGLAQACSATLILLTVVPTLGTLSGENAATGRLMPVAMSALLDINQESAESYLLHKVSDLQGSGISISTEVWRGDAASTIAEVSRKITAGLIVLGTHGKAGSKAFWSGSVAPKLPGLTRVPLLFVPLKPN